MDNRRIAAVVVLAVLALTLVPMTADSADADTGSTRMSSAYVYYAQVEIDAQLSGFNGSYLYFIDGSENDRTMDAYLADPDHSVSVTEDDRERIVTESWNATSMTLNIYTMEYNRYDDNPIYINGYREDTELVLEPYGELEFFVKAGDTFSFSTQVCRSNTGQDDYFYYYDSMTGEYQYSNRDGGIEIHCASSMSFIFGAPSSNELYYDVTYTATGASIPNGSATLYFAVCVVITVLVLAILVLAGLKPKWSK